MQAYGHSCTHPQRFRPTVVVVQYAVVRHFVLALPSVVHIWRRLQGHGHTPKRNFVDPDHLVFLRADSRTRIWRLDASRGVFPIQGRRVQILGRDAATCCGQRVPRQVPLHIYHQAGNGYAHAESNPLCETDVRPDLKASAIKRQRSNTLHQEAGWHEVTPSRP